MGRRPLRFPSNTLSVYAVCVAQKPCVRVMFVLGHVAAVLALAFTTPKLVAWALALLGYAWHDARVVPDVTCATAPLPLAMSPKLHPSVCVGTLRVIEHPALDVLHETSVPAGSASG